MNNDKRMENPPDRLRTLPLCAPCASNRQLSGIRSLARAASFLLLLLSLNAFAANEETFAMLKVGNHTYQNVTVTTKGKNFIIIAHSGGITSIKLSELPANVLKKLGYPSKPKKRLKEPPMLAGLA